MSANLSQLLLIDGHSLAFRAYYAFGKSKQGGLRTSDGIPTSVCFGFLKSLLEAIDKEQPDSVAIAFDLAEPTFRHQADPTYKGDRAETPVDFIPDLANLQQLLRAFNLPVITAPGYEADDAIATLSKKAAAEGTRVKIVSGDQDLFQLIDPEKGITVIHLSASRNTSPKEFGPAEVEEKLGILPTQVVDYKALCGDKSDNIPGVNGIGEKTAVKLLQEYQNLDNIYASIDKIKGSLQKKLSENREAAYHSRFLAQIVDNVPLEVSLADFKLQGFDPAIALPLLQKLELRDFVRQINQIQEKLGGTVEVALPSEPSLSNQYQNQYNDDNDVNNNHLNNYERSGDIQLSLFTQPNIPAKNIPAKNPTAKLIVDPTTINITQETETKPLDTKTISIYPEIIDTPEKLNQLVARLKTYTNPEIPVAWDTETTGLEPRDAQLVGIGCCWGNQPNDMAYIPIGHTTGKQLELSEVLGALREILESSDYPKALQNAKFDRLIFRCQGINLAGVVFDTMLASYLLNPDDSHTLTDLSLRYLSGIESLSYKSLNIPKGQTIANLSIAEVANYCGLDVYATFLLVPKLRQKLQQIPQIDKLLQTVEQPLEPVLADMEYQGIRVDSAYLGQLSQQINQQLEEIEQKVYQLAGLPFNLNSPKQMSEVLFDTLNLDTKKSRKMKTGYSTDAATLEKLQGDHEIIDYLLDHRTLAKLKSTYVDALPQLVRRDTQRVHTDFNQAATATGRLSSSNPNLQNIPIRTEFSRQIRQGFVPEPGWLLVSADYSQIELRILAHLSQEPVLIQAYQTSQDVHNLTAQLLFEKENVTPEERRLGKTINFGVIYGMGAQRFAREAGFTVAEGKKFIERFNHRYAQVFAYLETQKKEAIAHGYVATILGRRRYFTFESPTLQKLKGSNPAAIDLNLGRLTQQDSQNLRAAANAPIQGSSADIIKIAMVKVHQLLQEYQARLLLQVHDELVFEIPPHEWAELQPKICQTMETAVKLSVPLLVDIHSGHNWLEAK
ncbi:MULTISPECIES: DNA polymerase I [Planktothricoides]|uniref:DNA polymerase I n=1 Tax=Planktothricoides raciborskii FACHB-1370 TaxID=2949576 RepID=A0ABR8E9C2_9CYAN|nr:MULTISPECIES: DNA polymerase I [Planktothricoides]KOR37489.1 DNA polymerase I [Planktothricoides sp. SR001]MBD2543065.1 DNA polymerase I [Planktothricoides raciborskii FACHB-1370]MBD2581944.1 DNA polymerase I [Planktothricoides raciborskii FACHB-1261]